MLLLNSITKTEQSCCVIVRVVRSFSSVFSVLDLVASGLPNHRILSSRVYEFTNLLIYQFTKRRVSESPNFRTSDHRTELWVDWRTIEAHIYTALSTGPTARLLFSKPAYVTDLRSGPVSLRVSRSGLQPFMLRWTTVREKLPNLHIIMLCCGFQSCQCQNHGHGFKARYLGHLWTDFDWVWCPDTCVTSSTPVVPKLWVATRKWVTKPCHVGRQL